MSTLFAILAEGQSGGLGPLLRNPMVPLFAVIIVMWIFMLRSKKAQDRQRQEMLNQLKKGDRIQTIGGILGTVVEVREQGNEVVVKVDESSNTKIRFIRAAIQRVEPEKETQSK